MAGETAAVAAPSAAGATPGAGGAASFDTWGTGISHPAEPASDPSKVEGTPAGPGQPGEPNAGAPTPTEPSAEPGAGEPGAAGATDPSKSPAEVPEPDDLDVFAQSLGLKPFSAEEKAKTERTQSLADLDTPEKIAQAINPDGKASEKQQLENLQRLVGSHSAEVKTARELARFASVYEPFLARTASGETVMNVTKLAASMPPDVLQAQLDEAGLTVIPTEHLAYAATYVDYPPDVVDQVIPTKDMTYAEKVEAIEKDPKLSARTEALKVRRQEQAAKHRQAQQDEMLQANAAIKQKYAGLYDKLAKPNGDGQSALQRFNAVLPPQLGGANRATVAFLCAVGWHMLQPGTQREMSGAIRKHVEAQYAKKSRLPAMGSPAGDRQGPVSEPQGAGVQKEARDWGVR